MLNHPCLQGRNPCVIPVGGSNALGTWGYLEAAREMDGQLREAGITDVALVSGLDNKRDCCGVEQPDVRTLDVPSWNPLGALYLDESGHEKSS